jgi:hypothetical protein
LKLIIDSDLKKYKPQFILSQLDFFEFNINKFKNVYLYVDDINLINKIPKMYSNITLVMDKDLVVKNKSLDIVKIKYDLVVNDDFKKKIVKQESIYNFLYGVNKNG